MSYLRREMVISIYTHETLVGFVFLNPYRIRVLRVRDILPMFGRYPNLYQR